MDACQPPSMPPATMPPEQLIMRGAIASSPSSESARSFLRYPTWPEQMILLAARHYWQRCTANAGADC